MHWKLCPLLSMLILGAGCDTLNSDDVQVPPTDRIANDSVIVGSVYFPMDTGQTWTYQYRQEKADEAFGHRDLTEGVLTWTVTGNTVLKDDVLWTIEERFEGMKTHIRGDGHRTEEPVVWDRSFTAILSERLLDLGRYTQALPPVQWGYFDPAPDTVRVDTLLGAGFGRITSKSLTLVRDVGLVHWWGGTAGRGADYETFRLDENATGIRSSDLP